VRVAGVLHRGHHGRRVGNQTLVLEPATMSCWMSYSLKARPALTRSAMAAKGAILDPVERLGRLHVSGQGVGIPERREALHEIARGDDVHAATPDRLHCAGIDASEVRVGVLRGVFHRHA
jgi:hypothetical protein